MTSDIKKFRKIVLDHYKQHGRILPWRENTNPYWVLVSEVMLQQTQVPRGLVKFPEFIEVFPTVEALAAATTPEVLAAWQGLGYNRRALYLKRAAEIIVRSHAGVIPDDPGVLQQLPGIGPNTAASIATFAYNRSVPFIETNVRTVFLHHFFPGEDGVADAQLMPLIAEAQDAKNPREWYWALMDYGTFLKKEFGNASRRSRHYTKQSKFEGSLRQLRGHILRLLLQHHGLTVEQVLALSRNRTQCEVEDVLGQLLGEGFVQSNQGVFTLTS